MSLIELRKFVSVICLFIIAACTAQPVETPLQPTDKPTVVEPSPAPSYLPPTPSFILPGGQPGAGGTGDWVSHTAESGGGSVVTSELSKLNLARIAADGSELSREDKSTDLVYLPYLQQPINVEVGGTMVAYNFDHVDNGFAYYTSGSDMVKTPIRMPAIDGKEVVGVVNFDATGRGEIGFASLTTNGTIDQLFLGLVFGQNDEVFIADVEGEYQISGKDANGSFIIDGTDSGEWTKVEKKYTSCADTELIKNEVFVNFEKQTGYTPKEALDYFIANGKFDQGISYGKETSIYMNDMMSLGTAFVSMEQVSGSIPGDGILCGYGLWDSAMADNLALPEDVAPIVLAFVYKGAYYQLAPMVDGEDFPGGTHFTVDNMAKMQSWAGTHFQLGSDVHVDLLTFAGMKSVQDVTNDIQHIYRDNLYLFMSLFGGDYFERMSSLEIPSSSVGRALRPDLGDPGLVARFLKVQSKAVLPRK
ncbi:MAG: hypothetical protein HZB50_11450 [Chloroflexi bacterium]|nr:hypothetical protein [Chloroflexota bacterium]